MPNDPKALDDFNGDDADQQVGEAVTPEHDLDPASFDAKPADFEFPEVKDV